MISKNYKKIARWKIDKTVQMDEISESYNGVGKDINIPMSLTFKPSTIIIKTRILGEQLDSSFCLNSDIHNPSNERFTWANVHIRIKDISKKGFNINILKMSKYEHWSIQFTDIIAIE